MQEFYILIEVQGWKSKENKRRKLPKKQNKKILSTDKHKCPEQKDHQGPRKYNLPQYPVIAVPRNKEKLQRDKRDHNERNSLQQISEQW